MDLFPFPLPFPRSGPKYYELASNLCENQVCWKLQYRSYADCVSFFQKLLLKIIIDKVVSMCHKPSIAIFYNNWPQPLKEINSYGNRGHSVYILVDFHSHSHSHVLFSSCPIPMGLPCESHSRRNSHMQTSSRKLSTQSGDDRETSFLFQRLSVLIHRFNAILLLDSSVKEEEEVEK